MADRYRPGMDAFDTPLDTRKRWRKRKSDPDAFGRFAESTARFMGSPRFILYMTVFVIVWVTTNVLLVMFAQKYAWDPYPFILLNLAFSTQASYSAPLILLAQNRQDDRDRVIAEQDRQNVERNLADTEYLLREIAGLRQSLGEVATRDFVRSELRDVLEELERDSQDRIQERDERIAQLQEELDAFHASRGDYRPCEPSRAVRTGYR